MNREADIKYMDYILYGSILRLCDWYIKHK